EQWFKNGAPVSAPVGMLTLNEQTEGRYSFTVANELGARFMSHTVIVRAAPVLETRKDFRSVLDWSFDSGDESKVWGSERMLGDGSVTFFTRKAAYRWKSGTAQKVLDISGVPDG